MDENKDSNELLRSWLCYSLARNIKAQQRRDILQLLPCPATLGKLLLHTMHPKLVTDPCPDVDTGSSAELIPFLQKHLLQTDTQKRADQALRWQAEHANQHIITIESAHYPKPLADIADAPCVIYLRGDPNSLAGPNIAIVGSRKATAGGLQQAKEVASDLARAGVGTISGLARGIDAAAHRGCLAGDGITVAVSATSPDKIYPTAHLELSEEIVQKGAIVSEFPLGSTLHPGCFPRRNRIISGLSMAVLVVEAAVPSGTLTTAQHALNQGRDVLAMPGSVKNPLVTGCHTLIKDGGILATGADDILAALAFKLQPLLCGEFRPTVRSPVRTSTATAPVTGSQAGSQEAMSFLNRVGYNPTAIDELVASSEFSASKVTALLLQLELRGLVTKDSGGRYVRC